MAEALKKSVFEPDFHLDSDTYFQTAETRIHSLSPLLVCDACAIVKHHG